MMRRAPFLLILLFFVALVKSQSTCPEGFTGPQCALCQSDAACIASTNDDSATCDQNIEFQTNSQVKSFVCNPTGPSLILGLIEADSMLIQCHTQPDGNGGAGGAGGAPPVLPFAPAQAPTATPPPATVPPSVSPVLPAPVPGAPPPVLPVLPPLPNPLPSPVTPAAAPAPGVIVNGTDLSGLLDDAAAALAGRRRLLQDASTTATAPYCDISFLVSSPPVRVACKSVNCGVSPGSSNVDCETTTCACDGDPTCANNGLISSLAGSVTGRATLLCQPGNPANCTLALGGLPLPEIEATCRSAECLVVNDDSKFNGTTAPPAPPPPPKTGTTNAADPLIAAIPLFFLTVVVGFVGAYTWLHRSMWAAAPSAAVGDTAAPSTAKKVSTLEFSDVSVKVPMPVETVAKKRDALRLKALAHNSRMMLNNITAPINTTAFAGILPKKARHRLGLKTANDADEVTPEEMLAARAASGSQELTSAADFVVDLHSDEKEGVWTIVRGCSGVALAGEVIGVLGPSGCGKTTLLGALAGSALDLGASSTLSGTILVDGVPRRGQQVAYVAQADNLIPTLTVEECVRYSALLRLPRSTPTAEVHQRVSQVLAELGLRHIADASVGGAGHIRGISGGERRRVSIGMELVTDPSIIVLDEPTSGLDSYTAINLIRSLREVAAGGRIIIASLHQPSKDMFFALDTVILMGHGRILYGGRPEEVESTLAAAGVPCPPGTAVAEHMLQLASSPADIMTMLKSGEKTGGLGGSSTAAAAAVGGGGGAAGVATRKATTTGAGAAAVVRTGTSNHPGSNRPGSAASSHDVMFDEQASPESEDVSELMEAASPPEERALGLGDTPSNNSNNSSTLDRRTAGFARQLAVMFWRTSIDIIRNPSLLMLHVLIAAVVGVIIGAIFYQLQPDFSGVQNRLGGTFFALAFLAFTSLTTVDLVMNERNVVMREVRAGYYNPATYLLSKLALDGMMLRVIPAILLWAPFYYMAGFRSGSYYAAVYVFALISFNCCVGALSMAITIGCNTPGQAAFVLNFTLLFALAFGGFLVKIDTIPAVLRWLHYLSPFFYAFEAMLSSELNGGLFLFKYQILPTAPVLEVPNVPGEAFLASLGLQTTSITRDLGVLVALYAACMLMALLFFWLKMPRTHISRAKKIAPA